MYKHILLPTDGSDLSEHAVKHGVSLARAIGAKITGLTVTTPFRVFGVDAEMVTDTPESYKQRIKNVTAKYLARVKDAADHAGINCETIAVENEHPYRAIIDTAKSQGCDVIVMASHGRRGVAAVVLGSETVKVLTHSTVPVIVCRATR